MKFSLGSAVCVIEETGGGGGGRWGQVLKTHAGIKVNCSVVEMSSVGNVEWRGKR